MRLQSPVILTLNSTFLPNLTDLMVPLYICARLGRKGPVQFYVRKGPVQFYVCDALQSDKMD
jgi:hypothetical protein